VSRFKSLLKVLLFTDTILLLIPTNLVLIQTTFRLSFKLVWTDSNKIPQPISNLAHSHSSCWQEHIPLLYHIFICILFTDGSPEHSLLSTEVTLLLNLENI